jgi:hypothetical protein
VAAQLGPAVVNEIRGVEPWPFGDDVPVQVRRLQAEGKCIALSVGQRPGGFGSARSERAR